MASPPPVAKPNSMVKSDLKPQSRYEILPGPPLGKGHFAVVRRARDVVTGQLCAVKIIDKKELVKSTASVVKQEIEILKAVGNHPNIVQLLDNWEDATRHYLVMQLCEGGDLFSQIVEHGKYSEAEAVKCCRQLAEALQHIHACGITHRDLKPENILLATNSPDSIIKLADFGLSKLIRGHLHPMRTVCGTWAYCVAEDTLLRSISADGKATLVAAKDVTLSTRLVDEYSRPVGVKAIHSRPGYSRAQLWTVRDARSGVVLFRCTGDHKLSMVEDRTRRVEVRCSEFFEMRPEQRGRLEAYIASAADSSDIAIDSTPSLHPTPTPSATAASPSKLSHISRTFPILVSAPLHSAALEPFVGIEVSSETHRFQLTSGIVTSNCAPEVIQRRPYDSSVDNWTLGVLMYILLSGYHPFDVFGEMPEPELLQKIITCSYDFDDPVWTNISKEAKDLIRQLLVLDPSKRLTIDKYLASPWISRGLGADQKSNALVVDRLAKFSVGKTKFRALVVAKIASNKFKASISKGHGAGGAGTASVTGTRKGSPAIPLLPNGDPDYLGIGGNHAAGGVGVASGSSGSSGSGSGSGGEAQTVAAAGSGSTSSGTPSRGGTQDRDRSSPHNGAVTFEPSSSDDRCDRGQDRGHGHGARGGAVSVNGLDALQTTQSQARGGHGDRVRAPSPSTDQLSCNSAVEWTRDADGERAGASQHAFAGSPPATATGMRGPAMPTIGSNSAVLMPTMHDESAGNTPMQADRVIEATVAR